MPKSNWPTLAGRLSQPLTSTLQALEQLQTTIPLSPHGAKRLKKLQAERDRKLKK